MTVACHYFAALSGVRVGCLKPGILVCLMCPCHAWRGKGTCGLSVKSQPLNSDFYVTQRAREPAWVGNQGVGEASA